MSGGEHGHGGEAVVDEMHPHRNPETARDLASQPEQKSEHEDESDDFQMIPIVIRTCGWKYTPLEKLQMLPKTGKSVADYPNSDAFWLEVSEGIEEVLKGR